MNISQKQWIVVAVLVIVALIGLSFFLDRHEGGPSNTVATSTTTDLGGGASIQTTGGATVTELPSATHVPKPSLDRPISFVGSPLPADAQPKIQAQIQASVASLKKDPSDLTVWLELGLLRKETGDYEGARQAWAYVSAVAPTDEVSAIDLGDLYMNFIKDYPNAELYYKKAIANRPDYIDNYRNLYTLYHYLYKTNTTAAVDILNLGLKNNPGNQDLIDLMAEAKSTPQ